MNKFLQQIFTEKAANRKRLAALPFEEKLSIMEKLRDRAIAISNSPLRMQQPRPSMVAVVDGKAIALSDSNIVVLRRPVVHQYAGQSNIPQTAEVSNVESLSQGECLLVNSPALEPK